MLNKYVEEADYSELNFEAVTPTGEKATSFFCEYYPKVRPVLETAQLLCKKSLLKWIIGLTIIILDKIQESICD